MRAPDGGGVAAARVGGQIKDVAVATRGQDDDVAGVRLDLAGDHVAGDDAPRRVIHLDQLEHLVARVHRHRARPDLTFERLVHADEQLLAGLAASVERPRHLCATE